MYNGCNSCGGGSCGIGGSWLWIILIALVVVWVIGGEHGSCGDSCNPCGCDCGFNPVPDNNCGCNR